MTWRVRPQTRHLHQGEEAAAGVGQGTGVEVGEPLRQHRPQGATGRRLLGQERPSDGQRRLQVDLDEVRRELRVAGQLGIEDGLRQWAQHQGVVGGDQVDGPSHHHDADERPVLEAAAQLVRVEGVEARPQRQVRVERLLGLEAHQPRHDRHRIDGSTLEQELPGQGGPPEGPVGEHVTRHR